MHELYGIGEPYGMMGAEKVVHALNGKGFITACFTICHLVEFSPHNVVSRSQH